MMKKEWLMATLGAFTLGVGLSGWVLAEEVQAPEDEAAAPAAVEPSEEAGTDTDLALVLPPAPPRSLQTLVDERRDELQQRRRDRFDLYSGRYLYLPPGMLAHDRVRDQYRDAIRQVYRQQRDYNRMHRDAWMNVMAPWSKPHRDWAEARSYAIQMEQLNWDELRDVVFGPPFAYGGIAPLY